MKKSHNFLTFGFLNFLKKIHHAAISIKKTIRKHPLLSCVFFIAFLVRFIGILPHDIYNPDEPYMTVNSSKIFYNIVTKFDFDPHTYKYGSFIFYLGVLPYFPVIIVRYLLELLVSPSSLPSFQDYVRNLIPEYNSMFMLWLQRLSVATIGATTSLVLYAIGKKLFNRQVGLVAGLLLAVSPLHSRDSHFLTTDVPFTFFIVLAILAMINLFQTSKLKWYILSGLFIGFSSTIRYFPLALLSYPFAILLDKQKNLSWIGKAFLGLLCIPIGIFIGVPYLFLHPQNLTLFGQEMVRFVKPWYETTISIYAEALGHFIFSFGKTTLPPLDSLQPRFFKFEYVSLLFFHGIGPVASIASLIGVVIGIIKYPIKTLFILPVPAFLFLYLSSYVPAVYDRLAIPIIPFLALFAAITTTFIWDITKRLRPLRQKIIFAIVLTVIIIHPFLNTFSSSWECGKTHPYTLSPMWIDQNIPDHAIVAFKTHIPFPSARDITAFEITPYKDFFLEEARARKAEYVFINETTVLSSFMGGLKSTFFITPDNLYKNYFVPLSLYEYETRATLIHKIAKPEMCSQPTLLYYKLPPLLPEATNPIKEFTFDSPKDIDFWHLERGSVIQKKVFIQYSQTEGKEKPGSIQGTWENFTYVPPRISSEKIPVQPNGVYTFSGWIKYSGDLLDNPEKGQNIRDGFLRIDFYDGTSNNLSLPGTVVALSPRTQGKSAWRKLTVTAKSPTNAVIATLSLQITGAQPGGSFYFDDLTFLGPK